MTAIRQGFSYSEYLDLIRKLLARGMTTGLNSSPSLVDYTELNLHRMKRLNRTIQLQPETTECLRRLSKSIYWVLLVEAWCGDAAHSVPIIYKMSEASEHIKLKILLRDKNPEIMDQYLTDGARAIPRLICFQKLDLKELWAWGPRPFPAQEIMRIHKTKPVEPKEIVLKNIQLWYGKDKGKTIQKEIIKLIDQPG